MRPWILLCTLLVLAFASCQTDDISDCDNGNGCGSAPEDRCVDIDTDPKHCGGCFIACDEDEQCYSGTCCPIGEECVPVATGPCSGANCGGECIEVWNEMHCGGCFIECEFGQDCVAGECVGQGTSTSASSGADGSTSSTGDSTSTGTGSSSGTGTGSSTGTSTSSSSG